MQGVVAAEVGAAGVYDGYSVPMLSLIHIYSLDAVGFKEHMLGAAQADAFRAELDGLLGICLLYTSRCV